MKRNRHGEGQGGVNKIKTRPTLPYELSSFIPLSESEAMLIETVGSFFLVLGFSNL